MSEPSRTLIFGYYNVRVMYKMRGAYSNPTFEYKPEEYKFCIQVDDVLPDMKLNYCNIVDYINNFDENKDDPFASDFEYSTMELMWFCIPVFISEDDADKPINKKTIVYPYPDGKIRMTFQEYISRLLNQKVSVREIIPKKTCLLDSSLFESFETKTDHKRIRDMRDATEMFFKTIKRMK